MARALRPEYWERLIPELKVCQNRRAQKAFTKIQLSQSSLSDAKSRIKNEGWFAIEQIYPRQKMQRLAECVTKLERAGWPPVYAFVYDEFWELVHTPAIQKLLKALLGKEYQQKLSVWAHLVRGSSSSHGWSPHMDSEIEDGSCRFADGSPRLLSLWIPLTDATLDNGCMYLVPDRSRERGNVLPKAKENSITSERARQLLQAARAIPLQAGAVAGWRQDLLHWGSYSSERALQPRLSLAFEFMSKRSRSFPRRPLIQGNQIPDILEERLLIIGHQILHYLDRWEMHRSNRQQIQFAKALVVLLESFGKNWINLKSLSED